MGQETSPLSDGMVFVPGGTFRMDSDDHYAEEAPAHLVTASAVWIDRRQVTNADRAAFVTATGYTTVAERELGPADFPGAPIENLARGSLVFAGTRGPVDLRDLMQWWTWTSGASWRSSISDEEHSSALCGRRRSRTTRHPLSRF